jgi:hypothetical protein
MNSNQVVSHPNINFYQAIGVISGVLEVEGNQHTILIEDKKHKILLAKCVRVRIRSGKSEFLKVYPRVSKEGELSFFALYLINPEDRGMSTEEYLAFLEKEYQFMLRGCWENREDSSKLVVYRNQITIQKVFDGDPPQTILPLDWRNAPPADGSFWELKADLKDGLLSVVQVMKTGDPPPIFKPVIGQDIPEVSGISLSKNMGSKNYQISTVG